MAIVKVQSTTGAGATIVLSGVAAGNLLILWDAYFRTISTGVGEAVPTDSNGTFLKARGDPPASAGGDDTGVGIFYEHNAAAGTHTVTPEANTSHHSTLAEFSGIVTSNSLDATTTSITSSGTATSQATGTTPATVQNDELSIIAFAMGATVTGSSNVVLVDPVPNYTTLQIVQNSATDIALQHAYQILSTSGTQSATFNWGFSAADQYWEAAIATFKGKIGVIPSTGAYQQEQNTTDRYQLEDASGVYLIEPWGQTGVFLPPFIQGDYTGIGTPGRFFKDRLN